MHTCFVYGLRFSCAGHPHDGKLRYIGKSLNPKKRFSDHMRAKGVATRLRSSVRHHGRTVFALEILSTHQNEDRHGSEVAALAEEIRLIAHHDTLYGAHGLNTTIGGEGVVLVGEALERHRESGRKKMAVIHARMRADPVFLAAQADRLATRRTNPDFNTKMRAALRAKHKDLDYRERRLAASAAARFTPEAVQRHTDGIKSRDAKPGRAEAMANRARTTNADPEIQAKRIASIKARFDRPGVREAYAERARTLHLRRKKKPG